MRSLWVLATVLINIAVLHSMPNGMYVLGIQNPSDKSQKHFEYYVSLSEEKGNRFLKIVGKNAEHKVSFSGNLMSFKVMDNGTKIAYSGIVSGNRCSGTYKVDGKSGSSVEGKWSLSKVEKKVIRINP